MTSKTGIILRGFPVVLSEYLQSYDEGAGANGIPYLIFGNFKEYIFTVTKPLSVTGSAEAYFENDLYGYRGTMHFDGGVRRGEAFLGIKNKKA
jgi:HK97 family phage major capsid protein